MMTLEEIENALSAFDDEKFELVSANYGITVLTDTDGNTLAKFDNDDVAILCAIAPEALRLLLPIARAAIALEAGIQGNYYGFLEAPTYLLEDVVNAVKTLK